MNKHEEATMNAQHGEIARLQARVRELEGALRGLIADRLSVSRSRPSPERRSVMLYAKRERPDSSTPLFDFATDAEIKAAHREVCKHEGKQRYEIYGKEIWITPDIARVLRRTSAHMIQIVEPKGGA